MTRWPPASRKLRAQGDLCDPLDQKIKLELLESLQAESSKLECVVVRQQSALPAGGADFSYVLFERSSPHPRSDALLLLAYCFANSVQDATRDAAERWR